MDAMRPPPLLRVSERSNSDRSMSQQRPPVSPSAAAARQAAAGLAMGQQGQQHRRSTSDQGPASNRASLHSTQGAGVSVRGSAEGRHAIVGMASKVAPAPAGMDASFARLSMQGWDGQRLSMQGKSSSSSSMTMGAVSDFDERGGGGGGAGVGPSRSDPPQSQANRRSFQDPRNSRSGLALGTGNILMRHMQVWMREDNAPGHDLPTAKEYIAKVLSSMSSAEGQEAEKFVKGSAARIDNDQENPLLFMNTVKSAVNRVKEMLLASGAESINVAAAGGQVAARARVQAGQPIAPASFDLEGTVHTAVEYACVRPLLGRIMGIARYAVGDKEVFLQTKIQKLKPKAFDEYLVGEGAAAMKQSLRGRDWRTTIEHFNELSKPMLPSQALRILQRTVSSMHETASSQPYPGRAGAPVNALSQDFVTQILCYVIVQSSAEELRSIHLVIKELSPPVVVEQGPTIEGSSTWCYRVFSNAMSVIEGMTVSLSMDNQDQALAKSAAGGNRVNRSDVKKNSMFRHLTSAAHDERHAMGPTWLADNEVPACMHCDSLFGVMNRRHHCRHCGNILCKSCCDNRTVIPHLQYTKPVRVCQTCAQMIELTRKPPTEQPAAESELEKIMSNKKGKVAAATTNFHRLCGEKIMSDAATAAMKTRECLDATRELIMSEHRDELMRKMLKQTEDEAPWTLEFNLNRLINTVLERRLFLPVREQVLNCITQLNYDDEMKLERSLVRVRGRSQEFFDIPAKNRSVSNWAAAISHFNQIRREMYPSRMMDALLSSAKSIYETHQREHVKEPATYYVLVRNGIWPLEFHAALSAAFVDF